MKKILWSVIGSSNSSLTNTNWDDCEAFIFLLIVYDNKVFWFQKVDSLIKGYVQIFTFIWSLPTSLSSSSSFFTRIHMLIPTMWLVLMYILSYLGMCLTQWHIIKVQCKYDVYNNSAYYSGNYVLVDTVLLFQTYFDGYIFTQIRQLVMRIRQTKFNKKFKSNFKIKGTKYSMI